MKKWIFLSVVALVVILIIPGLAFVRIKKITCQTQYGSCPPYYLSRVNYLIGESLIFLPKKQEINSILSSYAEIAGVSLLRKLPTTLVLNIKLHQPFGIVNDYLVDDGGRILAAASESSLPRLRAAEIILPGESLTSEQLTALQAVRLLANIFPEDLAASLSGQILEFRVGPTSVLLDVKSLPNNYTDSLQLIFNRGKVDGKLPKKVDMRFNNPIIVY